MSDTVTDEMASALSSFQQSRALNDTAWSLTPADVTITALQQAHVDNVFAAIETSELELSNSRSFVMQKSAELVDIEAGDEPVSQTTRDDAVALALHLVTTTSERIYAVRGLLPG